ncbi:unnamed protein product [Prorocentrum cordatum]|uniref:Pentatricopeptide repeat-containing protein, chloroplastic n=1 Tax=Prorocentrum cordatum TaxID=2364126 RepID=A0ABN9X6I9_9DINO|nr:unnamed protein product [Polarella glacialis]
MADRRLGPALEARTAALGACSRAQRWERALLLAAGLGRAALVPDLVFCNATLAACEKGAQWQRALALLASMLRAGPRPDAISYTAALGACDRGSFWAGSVDLLGSMRESRLAADPILHNAVASSLERASRWKQALQWLLTGQRHTHALDGMIYAAAAAACSQAGQPAALLATLRRCARSAATAARGHPVMAGTRVALICALQQHLVPAPRRALAALIRGISRPALKPSAGQAGAGVDAGRGPDDGLWLPEQGLCDLGPQLTCGALERALGRPAREAAAPGLRLRLQVASLHAGAAAEATPRAPAARALFAWTLSDAFQRLRLAEDGPERWLIESLGLGYTPGHCIPIRSTQGLVLEVAEQYRGDRLGAVRAFAATLPEPGRALPPAPQPSAAVLDRAAGPEHDAGEVAAVGDDAVEWRLPGVRARARQGDGRALVSSSFTVPRFAAGPALRLKLFPLGSRRRTLPGHCSLYVTGPEGAHLEFLLRLGAEEHGPLECSFDRPEKDTGRHDFCSLEEALEADGGAVVRLTVLRAVSAEASPRAGPAPGAREAPGVRAGALSPAMTDVREHEFQPPARVAIDTDSPGTGFVRPACDGAEPVDEREEDQGRHRMARGRARQGRTPSPMLRVRVDDGPDLILSEGACGEVGEQAQITSSVRRLVRAERDRSVTLLELSLFGRAFRDMCRKPFASLPLVGRRNAESPPTRE